MGQEYSVTCPVCKMKNSTYKDCFEAECLNYVEFSRYVQNPPPFEDYLGPDCQKYLLIENFDGGAFYKRTEKIAYWLFYSCDDCISIGDPDRAKKFTEYNPDGVTIWRSQLP